MAQTVISALYPPLVDLTRTPLAYGDRALPRLNRELKDNTLLTRQRAVMSLCDYLHDSEHIAAALREGIPQTLKTLLQHPDVTLRQKSTECLYVIAGHSVGRDAFLTHDIVVPLSRLFDDPEAVVRRNAHRAMEMVSEGPLGAESIVLSKLVPILVKKLSLELDEIKLLILDTLHFCMMYDTTDALTNEGMEVLTDLLTHPVLEISGKAARDIMDISLTLAGKDKAVEVKCMPKLVGLLKDKDNSDLRMTAAGAISMISITTKGKYTALEADAIPALIDLLDDPCSETRGYVLKALTCLSEAPEGRRILLGHLEVITLLCSDPIPAVVKAANRAVKIITWKP